MTDDLDPADSIGLDPNVRDALVEVQRYFSDGLAPMMVADSVEMLLLYPPELMAVEIRAWLIAQDPAWRGLPVSDFLFHAISKVHQLGTFELVPKEPLSVYLQGLLPHVLELCPVADQPLLLENLARLGTSSTLIPSPVAHVARQVGGGSPLASELQRPQTAPSTVRPASLTVARPSLPIPEAARVEIPPPPAGATLPGSPLATAPASFSTPSPTSPSTPSPEPLSTPSPAPPSTAAAAPEVLSEEAQGGLRRFELLLSRFSRKPPALDETTSGPSQKVNLGSAIVAAAAFNARSATDLEKSLNRLSLMGVVGVRPEDVFRTLGQSLPGWTSPEGAEPPSAPGALSPAEALRRIVMLSPSPGAAATRIQALVTSAVEELNAGNLGRAAKMLELARQTASEKKLEYALLEPIRRAGQNGIDMEKLRPLAEDPLRQPVLRKILAFFPATSPINLLDDLEAETRRERRRLLLVLVEVHGSDARKEVLERLAARVTGTSNDAWHIQRNLLYLLRRIPRAEDRSAQLELELLQSLSDPILRASVVKEAVANLGQWKHEKAEQVLLSRLAGLEERLAARGKSPEIAAELLSILDRVVSALARFGTPAARAAVVEHGLKGRPELGNATARLADLGGQDLSADPAVVDRLVQRVRAGLPSKVLRFLKKDSLDLSPLVTALSGTPSAPVLALLHEIVGQFPAEPFAAPAAKAITSLEAARSTETSPASLSGDLDVFGLPDLLQSLASTEATGLLTLRSRRGSASGQVLLDRGRIRAAETSKLTGDQAFCQLFERPLAGTYSFVKQAGASPPEGTTDIRPLILEAMRRYDEFMHACTLVPDEARLEASEKAPQYPPDEPDDAFVSTVWTAAVAGRSALELEGEAGGDSLRSRRLLAFWVAEGSLAPRTAPNA